MVFFLFVYNYVAVEVLNGQLASVTPRVHLEVIRGVFPIAFNVTHIDVGDGLVVVDDLHVAYQGTYNPFDLTTQTGAIVSGTGTCVVTVFGYTVPVPIDNVTVVRDEAGWDIHLRTRLAGYDTRTVMHVPDDAAAGGPTLTAAVGGNIAVAASTGSVKIEYAGRTLLDARVADGAFDVAVAGMARFRGTLDDDPTDALTVRDVTLAFFDHAPHDLVSVARVDWGGDAVVATVDEWLDVRFAADGSFEGTFGGASRFFRAAGGGDDAAILFAPPYPTPFGALRAIRDDGTIEVGDVDLVVSTEGRLAYGPIELVVEEDRASVHVHGGYFRDFHCVRLQGGVVYSDPTRVVIGHVSAKKADEGQFEGHGVYNIPEKQLKLSFDVEINTL